MWLFDVLVLLLLILICGLLWMGWQFKLMQLQSQQRVLCAVEFRQSGTRCAFICGLIAVCCTKRIVRIFKDLELKNSIYVRYAFRVDDCTLGVFLEKGLPSAQLPFALG